jgi:hypothetical protein
LPNVKRATDPHPEFELHERLFAQGDPAAPALAGIRASEIADKLELYEKHFSEEWKRIPKFTPFRFIGWLIGVHHTEKALQIARMELKDLALAHATTLNDANAKKIQENFYGQYLELAGNMNDFHHFLKENYPQETRDGIETHRTLFEIAKGIMIEQRKKLPL